MFVEQNDLNEWKQTMTDYQSIRRPKVPKVENNQRVTSKDMKFKEKEFHPILQQYLNQDKDKQLIEKSSTFYKKQQEAKSGHLKKYDREYNIVNLGPSEHPNLKTDQGAEFKSNYNLIVPTIKDYNIITNQKVNPNMYKNVKALKEEKIYNKKFDESKIRDYNIISGIFHKDNDLKVQQEQAATLNELNSKLSKREYDFLKGKYYDQEKEQQYQENLKEIQKQKEKDAIQKLPPTMRFRESIIQDPTREVPEEIQRLDKIRENKKKRYQLRYTVEGEYHERDQQAKQRQLERKLNRLNHEKYRKERQKGFDIITLDKLDNKEFEKWIHKQPNQGIWDQIQQTKNQNNQDKENNQEQEQKTQKNSLEPFLGKKIDPPRFRATQSLNKNNSQNFSSNENLDYENNSQIKRKTAFAQTGLSSFNNNKNSQNSNNNLRQTSNYGNSFQNSFKSKLYIDDPRNATTQLCEPKINPVVQQPKQIKRIKTTGFKPSDEQYSQKSVKR